MTKVLFFILYMINGNLKLEQKFYDSVAECQLAGNARAAELAKDPHVDGLLDGACIELPAQEVRK